MIVGQGQTQIIFQKTFDGDSSITVGTDIKQTSDGGFILVGLTNSYGAGDRDIYVIKTNSVGDTIWTKAIGNSTIDDGSSIIRTPDNCYVITGVMIDQNNNNNSNIVLLKIDENGNIKWTKTFDADSSGYGRYVQLTNDGGFLISGAKLISGHYAACIIKTDSTGNSQWSKIFNSSFTDAETAAESSVEDAFGNYYITGETSSPTAGNDAFVIKFSSSGNIIWSKTYGAVLSSDNGFSICKTFDGNFVIIGYSFGCGTGISGSYLLKINSLGDTLWTKLYHFTDWDTPSKGILTNDNSLIITGYTNPLYVSEIDAFLFKIDSLGNPAWFKTYGIANTPYNNQSYGNNVSICSDGGYIINGETSFNGKESMYLIKTDKNGNSGCNDTLHYITPFSINTVVSNISFNISSNVIANNISLLSSSGSHVNTLCTNASIEESINNSFNNITIFPNPFNTQVTLQTDNVLKDATLTVYNIFGQQVKQIKNISGQTITLQREHLKSGLYFVRIEEEGRAIATEKLMIAD